MIEQKVPVVILSYLGQSKIYHTVHEIKTAKAEFFKCFDPKKKPAIFSAGNNITTKVMTTSNQNFLFLWKLLQKLHEKDQCYSRLTASVFDLIQGHQKRTIFFNLVYIPTD